jgi:hypothetical protein
VDAVIALLRLELPTGGTPLKELIATASTPGWSVRAAGAHFDVKDKLRSKRPLRRFGGSKPPVRNATGLLDDVDRGRSQ